MNKVMMVVGAGVIVLLLTLFIIAFEKKPPKDWNFPSDLPEWVDAAELIEDSVVLVPPEAVGAADWSVLWQYDAAHNVVLWIYCYDVHEPYYMKKVYKYPD